MIGLVVGFFASIMGILSWLAGRCLIWVLFLGEPGRAVMTVIDANRKIAPCEEWGGG